MYLFLICIACMIHEYEYLYMFLIVKKYSFILIICTSLSSQAGNKADLEGRRKVDFNEANAYAEENGILHMETSAKNSNNVRSLFVEIAKSLPKATQQPDREAFPIMPQKQESRNCC